MLLIERKPHVVVINHSHQLLELYTDLLGDEGYEVFTQTVFQPDLDRISGLTPICIIIDYFIRGDIAERSVLENLLTDDRTRTIPVIVCTGAVHEIEEMRERLEARSVAIVIKPFEIDELLASVSAVRAQQVFE